MSIHPPPELPANRKVIFPVSDESFADHLELLGLPAVQLHRIDDPSEPFRDVVEVNVDRQGDTPWAFRLRTALDQPVEVGEIVHVCFWARCVLSDTGSARLAAIVEEAAEPHEKVLDLPVTVGTSWQCVDLPAVVSRAFAADEWQMTIRLGYMPQRVRFAGLSVSTLPCGSEISSLPRLRVGYVGREEGSEWRDEALARIESLRKGRLDLTLLEPGGRPLAGATVRATLTRPLFGFGTCVSTTLLREGVDAERYRTTLLKLFNHAVIENELKWPPTEANGYETADRLVDWLIERRIPTRGHCLIWPSEARMPMSVVALASDPKRFRQQIETHIHRTVSRYRGTLIDWDVVNEPYAHHFAMDVLGGNQVMAEWFRIAHDADPACRLYINDYEILASGDMLGTPHQEHYFRTIAQLLEAVRPVHGVGMQGHFGGNITSPHNLLRILDRFASLGLRIKITEMDIQIADPTLQADFYRDLLIVLYSHPAVDAIMQWGFWEGSHWIPSSAIIDREWNVRPHGRVFMEYAHRRWRTDLAMQPDDAGACRLDGFAGEYRLDVEGHAPVTVRMQPGTTTPITVRLTAQNASCT